MAQQQAVQRADPSLLGIPTELRLQIFGCLLPSEPWAVFHVHDHVYDIMSREIVFRHAGRKGCTAVLMVCRQFYSEASDILHQRSHTTVDAFPTRLSSNVTDPAQVVIRSADSHAFSRNSLCLGQVEHVKTFALLKDLKLVIELPRQRSINVADHLTRIRAFVEATGCGHNLRKMVVSLKLPDNEGMHKDVEKYIMALTRFRVKGKVFVDCDDSTEDDDGDELEMCRWLAQVIEQ